MNDEETDEELQKIVKEMKETIAERERLKLKLEALKLQLEAHGKKKQKNEEIEIVHVHRIVKSKRKGVKK